MSSDNVGGQTSNFRCSGKMADLVITVEGLLLKPAVPMNGEKIQPSCGFPELHQRRQINEKPLYSSWKELLHRIKLVARNMTSASESTPRPAAASSWSRISTAARRGYEEVSRCVMENMVTVPSPADNLSRVQAGGEGGLPPVVKVKSPKHHFPFFIIGITLIEILCHIVTTSVGEEVQASPLIFNPHKSGKELWRYFTYMLLHANLLHLVFNLLIQVMLGIPLEIVHGHVRVAVIYLAGGFAGSLGTQLIEPNTYILGASAGVYALLTAHIADIILNFSNFRNKVVQILTVLSLTVADVVFTIYHQYSEEMAPKISWAAHAFGALTGLLLGLIVLKIYGLNKTLLVSIRVTAGFCLCVLVIAAAVVSFAYVPLIIRDAAKRNDVASSFILQQLGCCN